MFKKYNKYIHKNMKDVHFEVRSIEDITEEGVKLFINWHNHCMGCAIGPDHIMIKYKDMPYYSEFAPKTGSSITEEEISNYGEDMS